MGTIEVVCANQECDSDNISHLGYVELTCEVKHNFICNYCKTNFSIYTRLGKVKIPQEAN